MHDARVSTHSRALVTVAVVGVAFVFLAMPTAVASGTGSFNYERLYWGSNRGEVYIERAPRLVYNPSAPGDSYEPNGIHWYVNMYSYSSGGVKYVPDELYLTVYVKDTTSTGGASKWNIARWWPLSSSEYGTTITWSFSITGGNEYIKGGVSATVSATRVNKYVPDYSGAWMTGDWWKVGKMSVDLTAKYGINQHVIDGGIRLAIRNSDGPAINNHAFLIKIEWQGVWRGCGILACLGSHQSMYLTMMLGDNTGIGDGYMYVRTGDTSGS